MSGETPVQAAYAKEAGQAEYEAFRSAIPDWVCNVPGGPWEDLSEPLRAGFAAIAAQPVTELTDKLATALADLDAYVDRRAAELAAPKIAEGVAEANQQAGEARGDAVRNADLVAELRRRCVTLQRNYDRLRDQAGTGE